MMERRVISKSNFADIAGVSNATINKWINNGKYTIHQDSEGNEFLYLDELDDIDNVKGMLESNWDQELNAVPSRQFTSIELFAGAGGLALGMEKAGFHHILLNEIDKNACETLRMNRPEWNVVEQDIHTIDFTPYRDKVDFLSGGFPCQAFSFAGKRLGFEETRGTLFFELARAVKEIRPKVFLGENVRGLFDHDGGRTLATIKSVIAELGYSLVAPRVLKALCYNVPQKRERLFLVAIRNDLNDRVSFEWPSPCDSIRTLRDALFAGALYDCDVPRSDGQKYPESKRKVLELVPQGGDWRDLPDHIAKEYMKGSYHLGGGKTGMAHRLALDSPSLTLTCAPAQKQTERCHPLETRPLTIREYARIQTFPDDWGFSGSLSSQYKQIGNAVPVNLAWALGRSLIRLMNEIETAFPKKNSATGGYANPKTRYDGVFGGVVCEKDATYTPSK